MTRLEGGEPEDWEEASAGECDSKNSCSFAVLEIGSSHADTDWAASALHTARQLLVDRARAEKAIALVEARKRHLREHQQRYVPYTGSSLASWDARGHQIAAYGTSKDSLDGASDALTTDKRRDLFRKLMVLRRFASHVSSPLDKLNDCGRMKELKHLQSDIDQRQISLQQAEEAVQARAALRKVEAEHAKKLDMRQVEFEKQRQREVRLLREEMGRQHKQYEEELAKERARCESLRKEMELQAKELQLQSKLTEERIRETFQKQNLALEDELHRLREKQRQAEHELQRIAAEAKRETLAIKSAATDERASLSAAAQAAERKANDALKLVQEKEQEVKAMEVKLNQALAVRANAQHTPVLLSEPQAKADPGVQSSALSEHCLTFEKCLRKISGFEIKVGFNEAQRVAVNIVAAKKSGWCLLASEKLQAVAQKVAVGQAFTRFARHKRTKTITPSASSGKIFNWLFYMMQKQVKFFPHFVFFGVNGVG